MWLINTYTLQLEEFSDAEDQLYAILSHRWEHDEVLFEDMKDISTCSKAGINKFTSCCKLARSLDFQYVWIDTCCIDKKSSAELSEAINSMFKWYKNAKLCFAFLSDVGVTKDDLVFERQFRSSAWFTRSWTLQELIAPRQRLVFYNADWKRLGSKFDFLKLVSEITQINEPALMDARLSDYSIAERMHWASRRKATRVEDLAYSLLGIFDINMPMLYGEGPKAFLRLQEQICNESDDETIFAWSLPPDNADADPASGLLASSPSAFEFCHGLKPISLNQHDTAFVLTNRGLTGKRMLANHHSWRREQRATFSYPLEDSSRLTDIYLAFLNAALHRTPLAICSLVYISAGRVSNLTATPGCLAVSLEVLRGCGMGGIPTFGPMSLNLKRSLSDTRAAVNRPSCLNGSEWSCPASSSQDRSHVRTQISRVLG